MKHHPANRRIICVKDRPAYVFLTMIGLFAIFSFIIPAIGAGLTASGLINLSDLAGQTATENGRHWLRFYLMLSNLLPFAGTALLALFLAYKKDWWYSHTIFRVITPTCRLAGISQFTTAPARLDAAE